MSHLLMRAALCAPLAMLSLFLAPAAAQSDQDLIALTTSGRLVRFSTADTCATDEPVKVTGLQPSDSLLGIDFRPRHRRIVRLGQHEPPVSHRPVHGAGNRRGWCAADDCPVGHGVRLRLQPDRGPNPHRQQHESEPARASTQLAGFDIATTNQAHAALKLVGGDKVKGCGNSALVQIDLAIGATTVVGVIGTPNPIVGLVVDLQN